MIKVKLRTKAITGKRHSMYLDFYPAITDPKTGELTRREFLGIYIFDKPKSAPDKKHNEAAEMRAEQIRQKRDNELNKPEIYTGFEKEQLKIKEKAEASFMKYFQGLKDKRKSSNYDNWVSSENYLKAFTGGSLKFSDIDDQFCRGFKEYLLTAPSTRSAKTKLAQNSAVSYFGKFKAALKQGYKDGYLAVDLNARITGIPPEDTKRAFLTIEELNQLVKTECALPDLKKAALFSALTGLRFGDIQKLTWGGIEYIKGQGYFIHFKQQKTKGVEVMPIADQAYKLLGEKGKPADLVIKDLKYSAWTNNHLFKWLIKAGITKEITFHNFRHSFASLQLSKGTDIYTVSKMLGHKHVKTTQVYAKVMDSTKREASNKIILDFDNEE